MGEDEVQRKISVLKDKERLFREDAARHLGRSRDPRALGPLLDVLKNGREEDKLRRAAAKALGEFGDTRAFAPLVDVLKNGREQDELRSAAAEALGELRDTRAFAPLLKALGDKGKDVRGGAAKALGEIGDRRAVSPLLTLLKNNDNWWVSDRAACALGLLGDPQAIESLRQVSVDDKYEGSSQVCAIALARLGDRTVIEQLERNIIEYDGGLLGGNGSFMAGNISGLVALGALKAELLNGLLWKYAQSCGLPTAELKSLGLETHSWETDELRQAKLVAGALFASAASETARAMIGLTIEAAESVDDPAVKQVIAKYRPLLAAKG